MADAHQPDEARGLLRLSWRNVRIVAAMLLVGAAAGAGLSSLGSTNVSVTTRLFLSRTQPFEPFAQNAQQVDPLRYVANQVDLLTSTPVLEAAAAALPDHPTLHELQAHTKASTSSTADVISVKETSPSASTAARRANAIVTAYRTLQINDVKTQSEAAAAVAPDAATRAQILAQAQIAGDGIAVVEPASASAAKKSSSRTSLIILGAIIGLLLGVGIAAVIDARSARRRGQLDPAQLLGVPLLGAVSRRTARPGEGAGTIELHAARRLLATLEYASRRPFGGVLLVTAASGPGDVDAAVDIVAGAVADSRHVILVDARTTPRGRGADAPSLVELAAPEVALADVARYWTALPGRPVPVVPGRVADSAGGWLGPSLSVERALLRLSNEADLVVIDAPPAATDETFLLMGLADAGIVVVTPKTTRDELEYARASFEFAGRPLIGFITASASNPSKRFRRPSPPRPAPPAEQQRPALAPPSKA